MKSKQGRRKIKIGKGFVDGLGGFVFGIGDWEEDAFCLLGKVPPGNYEIFIMPKYQGRRG